MKLTILFFGALVDITGKPQMDLYTDDLTNIGLLNSFLTSNYPILTKNQYKIAVNKEIVGNEHILHDGDEVAFLPPFAGG